MDDATLLDRFVGCTLTHAEWNHRLHLRTATLYLRSASFDDALDGFRAGILALNASHGVRDTLTSGYHETLTVAWLRIIASRMEKDADLIGSDAFLSANSDLLEKSTLREFYSNDRIVTWDAKRTFVEPDLRPLPLTPT